MIIIKKIYQCDNCKKQIELPSSNVLPAGFGEFRITVPMQYSNQGVQNLFFLVCSPSCAIEFANKNFKPKLNGHEKNIDR